VADFRLRPLQPADIDAAYALLAEWQAQVFGEAEITNGMFSNVQKIAAAAFVAETEEGIVGHANMRGDDIGVLVPPAERRRGIGSALLRACEERAEGHVLGLTGVQSEPAAAPFARANGYEKAWEVWLMGIDLPAGAPAPEWPQGVAVRTFAPEDARPVKELLDVSYAEEPGHVPLPFEHWKTFMLGDPSFDPEAWFLAVAGDRIVGAALNWKEGYVKDLVVHPDWRGRGLGKALMQQTFGEFVRRGVGRVTLKTDSVNPTDAWRLYERLGMRTERTYEVFEKRV
jgi:mycothiol synthase